MSGCDIKAIFGGDDDESGSDAAVKITNELNGNYFLLEVGLEDGELNFIKDLNFNGTGTLSYDTCDIDSGPDCSGSMKYLVSNGVFTVLTDEINLGYAASDGSFMVHTDDGGNLRFAIELDNADPGTSVAGVYKGVGFFNGSDHEPSGDDMRLESRDITNLTFANGDFALSIYGCENPVSGTYSFDNSEHGEFKMDITVDGCDGGDSSSRSCQSRWNVRSNLCS